ncbi:DHBP synthase RibB-like alpha/beta domain-containing protein [Gorgonomyces haynaldii]|nr:DHBP synthase RibB-like alpha/beta domain-containing protein [Gorgonomyces haynaldii]
MQQRSTVFRNGSWLQGPKLNLIKESSVRFNSHFTDAPASEEDIVFDCSGYLLVPGLINAATENTLLESVLFFGSPDLIAAVYKNGQLVYAQDQFADKFQLASLEYYYSHDNLPLNKTVKSSNFDTIEDAIAAFGRGEFVIAVDNEDRENEGDLIIPAQDLTPEKAAFMIRYTRSTTVQMLANNQSQPGDFSRPGHVFPLRAVPGGVLKRVGHTEASVDLCILAGKAPVAAICEIVLDDGRMARRDDLVLFARKHRLCLITIDDLVKYRLEHNL